ncbi:MAG TPA: DUF4383 domain-containing protein [Azospirillum sp.]|nr:DUF4383 domain-containing protein [Azospirillum sp.]
MWSRYTALILGVAFAGAGLLGFLPAALTPPSGGHDLSITAMHGDLLGLFPVNVVHNLIHLAFALWGFFAFFSGAASSRGYLRSVAVIYVVLAVMGFIPGLNTVFGLVPIHGNDIWLHLLLAGVAGWVGFFMTDRDRVTTTTEANWRA